MRPQAQWLMSEILASEGEVRRIGRIGGKPGLHSEFSASQNCLFQKPRERGKEGVKKKPREEGRLYRTCDVSNAGRKAGQDRQKENKQTNFTDLKLTHQQRLVPREAPGRDCFAFWLL